MVSVGLIIGLFQPAITNTLATVGNTSVERMSVSLFFSDTSLTAVGTSDHFSFGVGKQIRVRIK